MSVASNPGPWFCLSDLHLGAEFSVLSSHNVENFSFRSGEKSQSLENLVKSLHLYLPKVFEGVKPTLVLNGDCLDFDFGTPADIIRAFQCFMQAMFDPNEVPLFANEVIYLPGNHDHRIWEQMKDQLLLKNMKRSNSLLDNLQNHSTNIYDDEGIASILLNELLQFAGLNDVTINLHYPNWATRKGDKRVIFHHGHFIESTYRVMSRLTEVLLESEVISIEELEAQNGGWIDFLWSSLGASESQKNIMVWMYAMSQDAAASHQSYKRLARMICDYLDREFSVSATAKVGSGINLERLIVSLLDVSFGSIFQAERADYHEVLSESSTEGLRWYLSRPVHQQLCREEARDFASTIDGNCQFIFGHTHKPFQALLPVAGYANNVAIYNSGGWVLDEAELTAMQGAAAIFVDKDLNTASLRLFDAPVNPRSDVKKYDVRAEGMTSLDDENNPLLKKMQQALSNPDCEASFKVFNEVAKQKAVDIVKFKQRTFFDPTRSPGIRREKSYDY